MELWKRESKFGCYLSDAVINNQRASTRSAANYQLALGWGGVMLLIGVGAWVVGMAIHNEALAEQQTHRPEPIYYCATSVEMPAFEPRKEMKGQRDI